MNNVKTKEEILEQINFFITPDKKEQILDAMEEYSKQENTELKEDLKNEEAKYEEISMVLYEVRKENTKLKEESAKLSLLRKNDYYKDKRKADNLYKSTTNYLKSLNGVEEYDRLIKALEEYKK